MGLSGKIAQTVENAQKIEHKAKELRRQRNAFIDRMDRAIHDRNAGSMSIAEFESLMDSMLAGKNMKAVLDSYNEEILKCESLLTEEQRQIDLLQHLHYSHQTQSQEQQNVQKNHKLISVAFITLLVIAGIFMFAAIHNNSPTGFAVSEQKAPMHAPPPPPDFSMWENDETGIDFGLKGSKDLNN